jgi:hypothetical protein
MLLAFVNSSSVRYSTAVLVDRMQYRVLHAAGYDLDRCDPTGV